MKIRTLLLTLVILLSSTISLLAKEITKDQAQMAAKNFFTECALNSQVNWNADAIHMSEIMTFMNEGRPAIYAFSNSGAGFILISADDALTPVLGYSFESSMSSPGINPNFDYLISEYIAQVKYVKDNNMTATSEIQQSWNSVLSGTFNDSPLADVTVGPLITTTWNQDIPYNELCPEDAAGPGGHVLTGCVATAMSMVMNYYKHPITGTGQHSYVASGYGTQTVNYGATTYEWDAIQNVVNGQSGPGILACALLNYHAGVSVNMHYGAAASGAYSEDVPNALRTYFKYSTAVNRVPRSGNTTAVWEAMLTDQLNASKPMYYSGQSSDGGHAWVCDGYQVIGSAKTFHFNFGWGGQDNGYYTSSNPNGFTSQQAVVKDFVPNATYPTVCSSKTLNYIRGSVEDGSGPLAMYGNNLDCSWLFSPVDTVKSFTFKFLRFDVASEDSLYFYQGTDISAPRVAAFSGSTLPADFTVTGDRVFVQFVTNSTENKAGWLMEFSANLPTLCSGTLTMVEPSGSFTDGSLGYNYRNNTLCKYKIVPPYATGLTLTFDEFDLGEGDDIIVKSFLTSELLATLIGNSIPDPITVPVGGFYIIFSSDSYGTGTGFKANYYTGNVANKELPGVSSLNISPNPASSFIMIRAYNSKTQTIQFSLNDMTGKNMITESLVASKGSMEKSIDVSHLNPGMYFLSLKTTDGTVTQKVVIK